MRRPSTLASALCTLLALTGCNTEAGPEELGCEFGDVVPRTIEVGVGTAVEIHVQCTFSGDVTLARDRALAATLRVVGADTTLDDATFSDAGLLTLTATMTPGAADEPSRGTLSLDEPAGALTTGRLFFHVGDDALRTEFADQPGDECFMICSDDTGRQAEGHFDGASCACATPTLVALEVELEPAQVYTWAESDALRLGSLSRNGAVPTETRRLDASVDLPGLDPTTLVHQEQMLIRNGSGGDPHLLWWGVSAAPGVPAIYAAMVPITPDGEFGAPVVLDVAESLVLPPVFVSAVELLQPTDPTALPRPMLLYAHQSAEAPMAWALVELFSGASGTGVGIFANEPTWGEVTPEEVQAGTASVGLTRVGAASRDPREGISPDTEARAWSVRPDPTDASAMQVSIYTGAGAGLMLESRGSLAPATASACWNVGPAPGGFIVSHQARLAADSGTSTAASTTGAGGMHYASASGEALGLAPLHDFAGRAFSPGADVAAAGSCAPTTPSTWPAIPFDDDGNGAVWVRPTLPHGYDAKRPGSYSLMFWVSPGAMTVPPGGTTPLTPTHAMPLLAADPAMPSALSGTLRALGQINGSHVALTQPLSTTTCTPEAPCTTPMATASVDGGRGLQLVFTGTGAPTVVAAYGDILVGVDPLRDICIDFYDRVVPPVIVTNPNTLDTLVVLTGMEGDFSGQLGVIHVEETGEHDGLHPFGLADEGGSVVRTLLADEGSVIFVHAGGRGGLSLERAERADLMDLAEGTTSTLNTTALGSVDGLTWDERMPAQTFTVTAAPTDRGQETLPAGGAQVAAGDGLRWAALMQAGDDSSCGGVDLIFGGAGTVQRQELSPASADGSCEGVERGALVGDFLGTGGAQLLTQRVEGTDLTLRLFYLTDTGLFAVDFGSYALPYPGAPVEIWGADLDHDGLTDVMLDLATREGVLIGFSDGLGGARDGLHSVMGVSPGLTSIPGPAPGIAAHFGKGTKSSTSSASTRPQLL